METFLGLVRALLVLQLVPRPPLARALYVYDASPAAGYVLAAADEDLYRENMPAPKTHYLSNQKNIKLVNERVVDSYFRILRATPQSIAAAPGRDRSSAPQVRVAVDTQPPKRHQKQTTENTAYELRNDTRKKNRDKGKTTSGVNQVAEVKDEELPKPNHKEHFRKHTVHEKHGVVSKGIQRNNRRPHRAHFRQKIYNLSQVRDKTLRKADDDRAARLLAHSSQTAINKHSHSANDKGFRKRNTIDKESILQTIYGQNDNQLNSPKYVRVSEDTYQKGKRAHSMGRFEAESEVSAPYAMFYSIHQEHKAPPLDRRAALEETAEGAYYRGGASSYVLTPQLRQGIHATQLIKPYL